MLEALEEAQQLDNTLIIFTSDHGDVDGAHRMEHKSGRYLITDEWKYCQLDFAGDEEALYHTAEDPHEIKNLAMDSTYQNKLKECRQRLDDWKNSG